MRVLLAYLCHFKDRGDYFTSMMPFGLTSIASYLFKNNFDVTLANYSTVGHKKAVSQIIKHNPDIVGISLFAFNRIDSLKLIEQLKKKAPHIIIVAGGPFATFLSDEILKRYKGIDCIVRGEGEEAFLTLLNKIKNGEKIEKIINGNRIVDLDEIPAAPEYGGPKVNVNPNDQFKYIITSRGCPNDCSYCSSPSFWGRKVAYRSAENIMKEVSLLYNKYGIIYFSIRDDNFTLKKDRVLAFTRLLKKSGIYPMWSCQARVDTIDEEMLVEMKEAGLEHIQYGVESGSLKILDCLNKSLQLEDVFNAAAITRKAGVHLSVYLMTGVEGETKKDVDASVSLVRRIKPHDGIVSPVAYYPGTSLYDEMRRKKRIDDSRWFDSEDSGLFVRNDTEVDQWIKSLISELEKTGRKFHYTKSDFKNHRKYTGKDSWISYIMEGDYCYHKEDLINAEKMYDAVIKMYPRNPWGYLRKGDASLATGNLKNARKQYLSAAEIVPAYYGSWLRLAETEYYLNNNDGAVKFYKKAVQLNPYDPEVVDLATVLKT